MSKPNNTLTLPTMSPSTSEIADWNQVLTINDVHNTSNRIKALEDAVKQLQQ
jgi:tetrahydromethanopterin S-methyltransferase subunit B